MIFLRGVGVLAARTGVRPPFNDGKEVQVCKCRGGYGNVAEKAKSVFASPTSVNARGEAQDRDSPSHQANLVKRSATARPRPPAFAVSQSPVGEDCAGVILRKAIWFEQRSDKRAIESLHPLW